VMFDSRAVKVPRPIDAMKILAPGEPLVEDLLCGARERAPRAPAPQELNEAPQDDAQTTGMNIVIAARTHEPRPPRCIATSSSCGQPGAIVAPRSAARVGVLPKSDADRPHSGTP
jgi:hypothetical protein